MASVSVTTETSAPDKMTAAVAIRSLLPDRARAVVMSLVVVVAVVVVDDRHRRGCCCFFRGGREISAAPRIMITLVLGVITRSVIKRGIVITLDLRVITHISD